MGTWFTDDITFCMSDCDINSCYRHPDNIEEKNRPHSFADLKGIDGYCEYYDKNGVRKVKLEEE